MGMPNRIEAPSKAKDAAGTTIVVGIICLAVGLGIGYYYGTKVGSSAAPIAASNSATSAPPQTQLMDPATFLANEASLKSMLGTNPKDLNALVQLGNLYYDNNKFSQAIEYYGKALEIDPSNVNVRTDRGSCYWSLGQADAAIAEFQKSLQVDPTHSMTLFNLGVVYLHGKNDVGEARKAWEKLLTTNPNDPRRSRIQEMLASLGTTAPEATPAAPGQTKSGSSSMDDLFKRMKK